MRICTISKSLPTALEHLGHEVLNLHPRNEQVFDLAEALDEHKFSPELIIQEENLGPRLLVKGLDTFSCPKVFWSLDTHLNLFWHAHYIRLFDGVLTPHVSIFQRLAAPSPPIGRLPWYGLKLPWRAHAKRKHQVGFVGRFTEHRPCRQWLAELLTKYFSTHIAQNISFEDMLRTYYNTCIAPNEAIQCEVNFRLFEAASCGCLVLSQDVGEDQDALFQPGKEIQVYSHALELKTLLDFCTQKPEQTEKKAYAAWRRVQKEHLIEHRAQAAVEFAKDLPSTAAKGYEAAKAFWLTAWHLRRAKRLEMPLEDMGKALAGLGDDPEVLAARIALAAGLRDIPSLLELTAPIISANRHANDMELNLAGSFAGVLTEQWEIARQFWYRHQQSVNSNNIQRPETVLQLCLLWAKELMREGVVQNPGFTFDPKVHLPVSAMDCLYLALQFDPHNLEIIRQIDTAYSLTKGQDYFRLGNLSELTLHFPQNWRFGMALGLCNLRSFRVEQGLEDLHQAWKTAYAQGKVGPYFRTLAASDKNQLIKKTLVLLSQGSGAS